MGMEDDAAQFLKKVVKTLSMALLWLLVNMTIGIYGGWMFFYGRPTLGNYLCYVFALGTLLLMLWYFYRIWREDVENP